MTRTGRFLATIVWPIVLILKLLHYALTDSPTHFMLWETDRWFHAPVYLLGAILVAWTIQRTSVTWLYLKAYFITAIAITSAVGDLVIDKPLRHGSAAAMNWIVLGVANLTIVMWRTSRPQQDGRA